MPESPTEPDKAIPAPSPCPRLAPPRFDPLGEELIDSPEANSLLKRKYREPYVVPALRSTLACVRYCSSQPNA